jgi:hypothetical protein
MVLWNLAEEYAQRFQLPEKAPYEAAWQFRERIARSLEEMEERLLAHEVLYNQRITGDPFANGELNSGYGDEFITRRARQTEVAFQHAMRQLGQEEREQRLLTTLCFWKKLRIGIP